MGRVSALADRHKLFLLEDAAQAHGATWEGRVAGSLGDAAAFSFYPSKNLGGLGDGGAVTTRDESLATRVRELRNLGQRRKGEHVVLGYNERLDGLQAALLRVKLPHLDGWNAARRRHAAAYGERLDGAVDRLVETPATPCVFHLFPIRVGTRDSLAETLDATGIQAGVHYSPAVPDHPAIAALIGDTPRTHTPVSTRWAATELSLPMFAELEAAEIERVAAAVMSV
jgi:dTDP-4-amino-4,6-dideoxygalactose transaminase